MARSRAQDWERKETIDTDAGPGILWINKKTGQRVALPEGVSPTDNPNAIAEIPAGEDADNFEDVPETAADRVKILLSKATGGTRASVRVYRIKPDSSLSYCKEYGVDEFEDGSFEIIRKEFGAGKFKVVLYGTNPNTNKYAIRGYEIVEIESSTLPVVTSPETSRLEQALIRLEEKLGAQPEPRSARAEMLEMMQMFATMKEVFSQPPAPAQSITEQIAAVSGIIDATGKLRDMATPPVVPEDPMTAMLSLAPKFLEVFAELAKRGPIPLQAPPMPARVPLPAPGVAAAGPSVLAVPSNSALPASNGAAPVNGHQTQDNPQAAAAQLRDAIEQVNGLAKMHVSPNAAANLIWEQAPEDLFELLAQENWFEELSAQVPTMVAHREWYMQTAEELRKIQAEETAIHDDGTPGEVKAG